MPKHRVILLSAIALIAVSVGVAYGWQAIIQLATIDRAPAVVMSDAPTVPLTVGSNDGATFIYRVANQVRLNQNFTANVKHYSATGDGTTNDTANVQAAIDAVADAGGGQVLFPLGTYSITTLEILDASNVTLVGLGRGSLIKSASDDEIVRVNNSSKIVIRDLAIEGDGDDAKTLQRGIQMTGVTDSLVENVHVKNCGYDGILLLYGCVGNTIANCHVDGCKDDGINIGGDNQTATTDTTVVGNVVENGTHDGIHISDGSLRTTATGNTIIACDNGVSLYKTNKVTISGNTIYNCTDYGIATPSGPNADVSISGNVIDTCARGMTFVDTSRYTVSGNVLRNCTTYGIAISENPVINVDATISGNEFTGGVTTAGLLLSGAKNVVASGNSFTSLTGDAVYIKSVSGLECSFITIANNHFRAIGDEGIEVESGSLSVHLAFRGNSFRDITGRCIEHRGGAYFAITDNKCIDSSDFTILASAGTLQAGFGIVERNQVIGGGSTEGIRVNNYNDVLIRDNVVTATTGTIGLNAPAGYRNVLENNLSDKTISNGVQSELNIVDDFLGPTLNSNLWTVAKGSDAECVNFAPQADQAFGKLRGTAGDDAGATMALNGVQLSSGLNYRIGLGLTMEFRVSLFAITNEAIFIGFTDQNSTLEMPFTISGTTLTSNATDAVGILFDTDATVDNVKLVGVANNTDATVQDAGVAPVAGTYATWRIEIGPSGAAKFYRNGAAIGTVMTGAITGSTLVTPVVAGFSRTNAVRNFDIDMIRVGANR